MLVVLVVLAVLVPALGAAPAGATDARPRIDQETWLEWQVADALNAVRGAPRSVDPGATEPPAPPLTGWSDLRDAARRWSDALADQSTMRHNPSFADGVCCWQKAGEVLAKVSAGEVDDGALAGVVDRAVTGWLGSSAHRDTILDGAFDHVGVGVTIDHAAGVVWITVDLREHASGDAPPGGRWYQPGTTGPARPSGGWPCDSDVAPYGASTWPLPSSSLVRTQGADRVTTALALSREATTPRTVLVASSSTPSDALAAAGLAGSLGAPVLLTARGSLDARVGQRLRQWRPREVVLLGGPRALSDQVVGEVARLLPSASVDRLQGRDRFATAAAMADRLVREGGNGRRVVLALGSHPQPSRTWADAVSVSGLAASHHHPVLLSAPSALPQATRAALASLAPAHVVVPGGPSGVSDAVLEQVRATVPGARVQRVAGEDRYATSRAVVALDQSLRSTATRRVHVVDGEDWPDALTAGPAAAADGGVMVLLDGSRPGGGGTGMDHLAELSDRLRRLHVTVVGGRSAVTAPRAATIRDLLHCL